jgi:glycosyltransferase involved in cell wall biosynthesis
MRILFLTSQFPFPPDSGGTIKTLSVLEHLRGRHGADIITLNREPLTAEQRAWAQGWGKVQTIVLDRGRTPLNLVRSYMSKLPLSVERNRSDEMADAVGAAVAVGSYDCMFADGWLVAQYVPDTFSGLRILHEHNAEYVIWERHAYRETSRMRAPLVRREAHRVRAYEATLMGRFDVIFAVSSADREALGLIGGDLDRIKVLPNLPDRSLLEREPLTFGGTRPVVLYFGTLSWQPNIEGLLYFLHFVFPGVRARIPEARFVIAGRGASARLRIEAERTEGVDYLGPVENAEQLYQHSRVFVEVTRSGGGTKLKILNALARGIPVVATPEAAEGIEVRDGVDVLIRDTPDSLAGAITSLMQDEALWERLSHAGRSLIRDHYAPREGFRALDEVLDVRATT